MDSVTADRDVGTLDIKAPLPHRISRAGTDAKLTRHNSESSVASSTTTPAVPRSSSFTGSKRFLTGQGLSARESVGIIDHPAEATTAVSSTHCDYQAARSIIMGTLTHSPKEAPPPPQTPSKSVVQPFVGKRPPTPPPMPHFTTQSMDLTEDPIADVTLDPAMEITTKRVRIDPTPPVELPAVALTPEQYTTPSRFEKKRAPLRSLSPLHNRLSLSAPPAASAPGPSVQDPKPARQSLFGLFSSRLTRREDTSTALPSSTAPAPADKQNAAPIDIAQLASAAKIDCPRSRIDENNLPLPDINDTSSDDSATHQVPNAGKRMAVVDQMHPETGQRQQAPLGVDRRTIQRVADDESVETSESEKYKDCESPVTEPKRRVEIFRRFRFVQEGRPRPEQLSDFIQTDVVNKAEPKTTSPVSNAFRGDRDDPISNYEDKLSFTSGHEDGERSSDERPPPAMRDIRRDPRMRNRPIVPPETDPKTFEERGHLPHVESITTSSSSHSKDTYDSPSTEKKTETLAQDTSGPYSQVKMPHLRLGKGGITAQAFLSGPSPTKMGKVAQVRRDSHAAFVHTQQEAKLEGIKYGGHQGERATAPLGPVPAVKNIPTQNEGGEIKKTKSGLQKRLKEAGAELVNKAKKIPRGSSFTKRGQSFSKMRSNSMKGIRRSESNKEVGTAKKPDAEEAKTSGKGVERSMSLPRDPVRSILRPPPLIAPIVDSIDEEETSPSKKISQPATISPLKKTSQPKLNAPETKRDPGGLKKYAEPEVPEFVTIKRIIRRVKRDGTEEMVTKKVRVRPERVLPNGDVVIKRTMKRNKDDEEGTETLSVLQVIPRRKTPKKVPQRGDSEAVQKTEKDIASLPNLKNRREDKGTEELGATTQAMFDDGPLKGGDGSDSRLKRLSSSRSKTDVVDDTGRKRRARSFGKSKGETENDKAEQRPSVLDGVMGLLPRTKSGSPGDRETDALGGEEEEEDGRTWLRKKSIPRVMSFHGRNVRRKESGSSSKSEGLWRRFRR